MATSSIVDYRAEHGGYRCGYCNSSNTNYSHGMWAHQLSVEDYQDLIDRGWRRSGKYTYKPTMSVTCCPMYPIRCAVADLQLTKSQKKIIKRVNQYLSYDRRHVKGFSTNPQCDDDRGHNHEAFSSGSKADSKTRFIEVHSGTAEDTQRSDDGRRHELPVKPTSKEVTSNLPKPGVGPDPNKPPVMKAKLKRLEKKCAKAVKATLEDDSRSGTASQCGGKEKCRAKSEPKTLEDYLNDVVDKPAHKLELRLVRSSPRSKVFDSNFAESHRVYHKYQTSVHQDPAGKPSQSQFTRFLVDSPLTQIKLVRHASNKRGSVVSELLNGSHAIYKKYQMKIHREEESDCTLHQFKGFLVDTPLTQPPHLAERGALLPDGFGSFHQHYILDGKIIAVGVIDILPHCVSSVYFFYDPEYAFLSLGTYSALRELSFTRSLHLIDPEIQYYYLGFYIHSCPKMRYKSQYVPSYLCCPETYRWFSIEECRPKLDASKYSRFAEANDGDDDRVSATDDISDVLCLHQGVMIPFGVYHSMSGTEADVAEVRQYAEFVGRKCSRRMLLCR